MSGICLMLGAYFMGAGGVAPAHGNELLGFGFLLLVAGVILDR